MSEENDGSRLFEETGKLVLVHQDFSLEEQGKRTEGVGLNVWEGFFGNT